MKQTVEIVEISDFAVRPGTKKSFFVGKLNGVSERVMISEAVKEVLAKKKSKPQDAAKFIVNECQIQIDEFGKMIVLAPKLGTAMFTFSGTIRK